MTRATSRRKVSHLGFQFQKAEGELWCGGSSLQSQWQEQERIAHILNHKQKAEKVDQEWSKSFKLSKPVLSDVFPPARPHLLNLPS